MAKSAGYAVELLVNGNPVVNHSSVYIHSTRDYDSAVITGRARLILHNKDKLTIQLRPAQAGKLYVVQKQGTYFNISRDRLW